MDSILTSVKKLLGLPADYEAFDPDIIMYINTVLMILSQMGGRTERGLFYLRQKCYMGPVHC